MIWCNKTNFINKIFHSNNKEVRYLKKLIENKELSDEFIEIVNEFLRINNNFDLQKFVNNQYFINLDFTDDLLAKDFIDNREKVAFEISEFILSLNKGK